MDVDIPGNEGNGSSDETTTDRSDKKFKRDEEASEENNEEDNEPTSHESDESIEHSDFEMFDKDDYDDSETSDEEIDDEIQVFGEFSDTEAQDEKVDDKTDETLDEFEEVSCDVNETEFLEAIDSKNNYLINSLLKKTGILRKKFSSNKTILHIAAERGTAENVARICNLGADVNVPDKNGETPIFHAAAKNSTEILQVLIDHRANVNITSKNGVNPLHLALFHGSEQTVRLTLKRAFAEIDERISLETENNGDVSMSDISDNEHEIMAQLVKHLLKHKTRLNLNRNDYPLLIFFAAKMRSYEIMELVLRDCRHFLYWLPRAQRSAEQSVRIHCKKCPCVGKNVSLPCDLNFQGHFNATALHYAVRQQLPNAVRFLLQEGADPNCQTVHGWTPLLYAVYLGNEEICRILIEFGSRVNVDWRNPLQQICGRFHVMNCYYSPRGYFHDGFHCTGQKFVYNPGIVKLMLKEGAYVNSRCYYNDGRTPLHEACMSGRLDAVKILLKFRADYLTVDRRLNSALHYAAIGNSLEIVDILLDKGLRIDAKNARGYTPLMFVIKFGEKKFNAFPFVRDKYSAMSRNVEMVEYLVRRGASLNARNREGGTPLHVAVDCNLPDLVITLLELGADQVLKQFTDPKNRYFVGAHIFPDYSRIGRNVLISQIVLHEHDYRPYAPKCFFNHNRIKEAAEFFQASAKERARLKSTLIFRNRSVTYFDFLTRDLVFAAQFVKNPEIRDELLAVASWRTTNFPYYGYFFARRLNRIENFKIRVEPIKNFFVNYGTYNLPLEIVEIIVSYLCWHDVQVFSRILTNVS